MVNKYYEKTKTINALVFLSILSDIPICGTQPQTICFYGSKYLKISLKYMGS